MPVTHTAGAVGRLELCRWSLDLMMRMLGGEGFDSRHING